MKRKFEDRGTDGSRQGDETGGDTRQGDGSAVLPHSLLQQQNNTTKNKTDTTRNAMSVCCLKLNINYHSSLFCVVCTNWCSLLSKTTSFLPLLSFILRHIPGVVDVLHIVVVFKHIYKLFKIPDCLGVGYFSKSLRYIAYFRLLENFSKYVEKSACISSLSQNKKS